MKIEVSHIKKWNVALKVRPIMVKPLLSVLVDKRVSHKFLLNTLEGREVLGDGSVLCLGESGDIWQQMPTKLLQKYDVVSIDEEGWMKCEPKPGNSSDCVEITEYLLTQLDLPLLYEKMWIEAQWGEKYEEKTVQFCDSGDFILRDRINNNDIWIVKRKIFLNTYIVQ